MNNEKAIFLHEPSAASVGIWLFLVWYRREFVLFFYKRLIHEIGRKCYNRKRESKIIE